MTEFQVNLITEMCVSVTVDSDDIDGWDEMDEGERNGDE